MNMWLNKVHKYLPWKMFSGFKATYSKKLLFEEIKTRAKKKKTTLNKISQLVTLKL